MRIFFLTLAVALLPGTLFAQSEISTLEERMPQSDFRASGLDKLSPEELRHLNDWLRGHAATPYIKPGATPEFYPDEAKRETIETKIDGRFVGWHGKTTFKLENGQEWQQAESGSFGEVSLDHPSIRLKPMLLGSWLMYVDGCGCSVRVKRLH